MSAIVQEKSSLLSGRYTIYGEIASGGMASVMYGRLIGPVGFARPVAIKRLHPHIARDPSVASMFIDEARICARVSHANVVPILDVIQEPGELSLVMEYVHGCTLDTLLDLLKKRGERMPLRIAGALMLGVLHGLEAAHEARNEQGELLQIVHRDVSPQNIMLGVDGLARLFDFGIAKARGRVRSTPSGEIKGKLAYMAPEQLSAAAMDARVDIYAAAVVLWEMLTGRMLFDAEHESSLVHSVIYDPVEGPRALRGEVSETLDALVLRGLARDPAERFGSVREMARALERALVPASQSEVSEWLDAFAGEQLRARAEWLRELQRKAEQGAGVTVATERLPSERSRASQDGTPQAESLRELSTQRRSFMRKRSRARLLLLLALLALLPVLTFALWPEPQQAPAGGAPRAQEVSPPAANSEDWRSDEPAVRVMETAPLEARDEPEAGPPGKAAPPEPRPPPPAAKKPKAANCREPYVIDALGVKHWKRECL